MCILHVNVETTLKRQKSWVDYDATIRNIYVKEDDEVSRKCTVEDSQKPSDSCKYAYIHIKTHTTHTCNAI